MGWNSSRGPSCYGLPLQKIWLANHLGQEGNAYIFVLTELQKHPDKARLDACSRISIVLGEFSRQYLQTFQVICLAGISHTSPDTFRTSPHCRATAAGCQLSHSLRPFDCCGSHQGESCPLLGALDSQLHDFLHRREGLRAASGRSLLYSMTTFARFLLPFPPIRHLHNLTLLCLEPSLFTNLSEVLPISVSGETSCKQRMSCSYIHQRYIHSTQDDKAVSDFLV